MNYERHIENAKGDFYVENGGCLACGAPQVKAPDLIEHSKQDTGHCFFKKQPETQDEIDRAISAIAVSCVGSLRYGGTDQGIIEKLYDLGCKTKCDNRLENK